MLASDEHVKVVGPLRIGIPLFNIYLNEADELSRRLTTEVAEWAMELHRAVGEVPIALAHSLAGSSATVGFTDLSHLARSLEHALARTQVIGHGTDEEARLFVHAAEEIRRLLHQFAAGFLLQPSPDLLVRLAEHELSSARRLEAVTAASELAEGQESESPIEPALTVEPLLSLDALADSPDAANDSSLEAAPPNRARSERPSPSCRRSKQARPTDSRAHGGRPARARCRERTPTRRERRRPIRSATRMRMHRDSDFAARDREGPPTSMFGGLGGFNPLGVSELKTLAAAPVEPARPASARASTFGDIDDEIDAIDAVDLELFPIFEEEAQELLPKLDGQLRDWLREPHANAHAAACMRTLHTLKGGARLAGAMRLGEMAHRLETRIERLTATDAAAATAEDVEALQAVSDAMTNAFEALRSRDAQAYSDAVAAATAPMAAAARAGRAGARTDGRSAGVRRDADRRARSRARRRRPTARRRPAPRLPRPSRSEAGERQERRRRRRPRTRARPPRSRRRGGADRGTGRAGDDRLVALRAPGQRHRQAGRAHAARRSRRCASARRCSIASSTRPAR